VIAAARVLDHGGIFDLMKEAIASTSSSNANIDFLQYRILLDSLGIFSVRMADAVQICYPSNLAQVPVRRTHENLLDFGKHPRILEYDPIRATPRLATDAYKYFSLLADVVWHSSLWHMRWCR